MKKKYLFTKNNIFGLDIIPQYPKPHIMLKMILTFH